MRKVRHPIVLGILLGGLALLCAVILVLRAPLSVSHTTEVFIPKGSSIHAAVDSIDAQCALPTPRIVMLLARITATVTSRRVQSGWYSFGESDTQWDVLRSIFSSHKRTTIRITIPEGFRLSEIASRLHATLGCDSLRFMQAADAEDLPSPSSMEGFLKPDTYEFFWKDQEDDIVERMANEFEKQWAASCEPLLAASGMSKLEVITLASIVQAEAAVADEMPRIAGVYLNRLRIGMPLAADPSVQYGLGDRSRVLLTDLNKDTPYNTYLHRGLPPGPINNPGLAALLATLKPERHRYLFFVARGDGSGRHNFSATAAQHADRVRQYRKERRKAARR